VTTASAAASASPAARSTSCWPGATSWWALLISTPTRAAAASIACRRSVGAPPVTSK